MKRTHLLGLCLLLLSTFTLAFAQDPAPTKTDGKLEAGSIRAFQIKGLVQIIDKEDNVLVERVKRGASFEQGTILKTGENSNILLMFSNGSTMNLGANSKLEISVFMQAPFDPKKGRFAMLKEDPSTSKTHTFLYHGESLNNVKKLHTTSTYALETPVGTAGIRGTTFFVSFGVNESETSYVMQISNFDGEVFVESPLEIAMVMSDNSVAAGKYNPYSGPKLYDVPREALIVIEAPIDLNLGDPKNMRRIPSVSSFDEFLNNPTIQTMIKQLNDAVGGGTDNKFIFVPTGGPTGNDLNNLPNSP